MRLRSKNKYSKATTYLVNLSKVSRQIDYDKYGLRGVEALASATPIDSGKTSSSWEYKIVKTAKGVKIQYDNTNIVNGVPIAIILQYGHGTNHGGYVQGIDYINPALKPIFNGLLEEIKREVNHSK